MTVYRWGQDKSPEAVRARIRSHWSTAEWWLIQRGPFVSGMYLAALVLPLLILNAVCGFLDGVGEWRHIRRTMLRDLSDLRKLDREATP